MNLIGLKRLETERLILRKAMIEDAKSAFANWTNDPVVTKFLTWQPHGNVLNTEKLFEIWSNSEDYIWLIELKSICEPIGSIAFVGIDEKKEILHVGYCIGQKWWRQGIMSEALARVIKFGFEEIGANRIKSTHDPRNPASGRVMQKCGMKFEGIMRERGKSNLGIFDEAWYSLLKMSISGIDKKIIIGNKKLSEPNVL